MVSVLHKEIITQSTKARVQEVGGQPRIKNKSKLPVGEKNVQDQWLINTVSHLPVKNNNERQGAYWLPFPENGDGLFERGGLFDGGA